MKTVFLVRDGNHKDSTEGMLIADGKVFYTIENPWLDNARSISCFPKGEYRADHLPRSASGRYRDVYHIKDVPGRTGILIHAGNITAHTEGCLLIGKRRGWLSGQRAVLSSKTALREFVNMMGREPFKLIVLGGYDD